jgi:hypothetical protein
VKRQAKSARLPQHRLALFRPPPLLEGEDAARMRKRGILREIDRHRETLRQDVRRAMQQVDYRQLRLIENTSPMRSIAE